MFADVLWLGGLVGSVNARHDPLTAVFGEYLIDPVVSPVSVDVQVPRCQANARKSELLDDPQARGVLRPDGDLDAVHTGTREQMIAHQCHRHRHDAASRSEEHTSELQSRFDLVCRLLLEKTKK